jgi:hypothetical protein
VYKGSVSWEREASSRLPLLLESWLRTPAKATKARAGVDLVLQADGRRFAFEVKGTDDIATLQRAAEQLARYEMSPTSVKAVAVPYMGPKARSWAAESGVSWVDLSGNADVHADQLRIVVSGEKNRYATAGRPSNPFTPRYARVSRALLHDADRWWKQVELAHEVDVPSGTVSKVVQHLDGLELLSRNKAGELRAASPSLLLDSWAQRYRFAEHSVRKYHVPARSGSEALQAVAARLSERDFKWAATGLSAAWLYTSFAGFRLNTFLVDQHPVDPSALGLRPVDKGENVWLVVPKDDGAFYGMTELAAWCAHPVQVYLDLLAHPERAAEAAQALREQRLTWRA